MAANGWRMSLLSGYREMHIFSASTGDRLEGGVHTSSARRSEHVFNTRQHRQAEDAADAAAVEREDAFHVRGSGNARSPGTP